MSCEVEKAVHTGESKGCLDNLRMQIKDMGDQNLETAKIGDRLSRMVTELVAAQGEIFSLEAQAVAAEDAKLGALAQVGVIESAMSKEKLKSEELQRNVDELNETILHLRAAATDAEEKIAVLSEREEEFELKAANTEEEVVFLKRQLENMQNLEKELLEKNAFIERLKLELGQTKELQISCEKIASDAIMELKKLKEELELQERKHWDQCRYINLLETELKQLMEEAGKARDEVAVLNDNIATMKAELDQIRTETAHSKDRVLEAQVENALLKVELHKWRSKAAAAEAAEARSLTEKLALNRALQLAVVSQETKQENRESRFLKQAGKWLEQSESSTQRWEDPRPREPKTESEQKETKTDTNITISRKEYELLINKAERADQVVEQKLEKLKRDLMTAAHKIAEFRTRAEQAISRAEAAEKAKAELEDQIKRRKEQKEKMKQHEEERKKALEELRKECISGEGSTTNFEVVNTPIIQPLGKVLQISL